MDVYLGVIIILGCLAISNLVVGVSNDAANFLNSSLGARVAPRHVIMIIASLGMLAGVTFSKGMMEVARKGIFNPKYLTMPELMVIFLAVMVTNVLLLDFYNTFGLPTSTTVAIVFGLLGASVAVALIKVSGTPEGVGSLVKYINTGKALAIISGILLSVMVAFICGSAAQFFTRLVFTFDFAKRLKRYGAIWGGLALSVIIYFILIKGAKGSTLVSPAALGWIMTHKGLILLFGFLVCAFILQLIMLFTKINILKPIVLIGTFALAMSFAANDLVNFIGVPLAGLNSYQVAAASSKPLITTMTALQEAVPSNTPLLLLSGIIMAVTLWFSRKARTVTATEINLGRQDEGEERFGSSAISRTIVRMFTSLSDGIRRFIPRSWLHKLNRRFDHTTVPVHVAADGEIPSFDLIRASVNLVIASALISLGTSLKLPLSTTYVTFMVAMGTSFSDRAWDRDSAVFRVTGVFTVIGGWFLTAFMTFTVSGLLALVIFYLKALAVIVILILGSIIFWRSHHIHKKREKDGQAAEIFNLKKVKDGKFAISTTFEHAGYFIQEVSLVLTSVYDGLEKHNRQILKNARKESKKIRGWANIITANIFKTMRLLQKEDPVYTHKYAQTVSVLQEIAECQRDAVRRAYDHVDNHHKPLLSVQLEELKQIKDLVVKLLEDSGSAMRNKEIANCKAIEGRKKTLERLQREFDKNQVKRIQAQASKTRLSILFYGFIRDSRLIAEQTLELLNIFQDSFHLERCRS